MVFWDNKILELLDMECGRFSISCRFRNSEDGFVWMFTGVQVYFEGEEAFQEELGTMWYDPWCLSGTSILSDFLGKEEIVPNSLQK